jgi:hypothetical protein
MALADRRPIDLSNNAVSPDFNSSSLNLGLSNQSFIEDLDENGDFDDNDDIIVDDDLANDFDQDNLDDDFDELQQNQDADSKGVSLSDLSPTSRSISPDSLMSGDLATKEVSRDSTPPTSTSTPTSAPHNHALKDLAKKPKNPSRVPIATGISTTIPVTGEKPRPEQKGDPSLEDDVLYAIFVILYEKDPEGKGMTVKQICDILIAQHPEMANLSTKTSNLVSAKLNAYVKRVEKGDANLKYALSRDWADASPKRMVYVYRGLLAEDFHVHVKSMMEMQKVQQNQSNPEGGHSPTSKVGVSATSHFTSSRIQKNKDMLSQVSDDPLEAGKLATLNKPRRQTMFDLGITRNTFVDSPIDKSNLFVPYSSAPVTASLTDGSNKLSAGKDSSRSGNKAVNESDNDFEDFEVFDDDEDTELDFNIEALKKNGKRSKSMSYLAINKKSKILTAAAAAPRASRAPSSHSPNAAAAAAALHAAALKASGSGVHSGCNKKWLNVIRSGFLTQDIAAPEDTSLSDIDKFFP